MIATRISGDANPDNNGLFFFHSDHLGSNRLLTNSSGGAVVGSTIRYYPFGHWRTVPTADLTDRGFTGHLHDMNVGLIYMNARWYSAYISRFASADTVIPNPANPQSYNRYSYVLNRPLGFTDPTGHRECDLQNGCGDGTSSPPISSPPTSHQQHGPQTIMMEIGHVGAVPISIIILPPGSKREAPAPLLGKTFDIIGIGLDVAEATSAIFMVPALPNQMAVLDIVVEFGATLANGDTFIGRPHDSAPMMAIVGQDVWWTLFEAAGAFTVREGLTAGAIATGELHIALAAYFAGNVFDAGTSATSAIYDLGRLTGAIPNVVSFGIYFDERSGTRIPLPGMPAGQPGFAIVIYQEDWFNYTPLIE